MTKITTKGQITIPTQIREEFQLGFGDKVEFTVDGGKIILRKIRSKSKYMESCGAVQVSLEEYNQVMKEIRPQLD